jgi:hypothetical protein
VAEKRLMPIRIRGSLRFKKSDIERLIVSSATDVGRVPTEAEWPIVLKTANELWERWSVALESMKEILSIWSAMPPSNLVMLESAEEQLDQLNDEMRLQLVPFSHRRSDG